MKTLLCLITSALLVLTGCVSDQPDKAAHTAKGAPTVVDAGCGQCLLGLKETKGCDLAVRLNGQSYFVDGVAMNDLGDAHAADGMCNTLRKARVTGQIVNNRFQAGSFDLLPIVH